MDHILSLIIELIVLLSRLAKPLARLGVGSFDEWESESRLKILLAGYNGARNTGSDVRVAAIAKQVKEIFGPENVKVTVMTLDKDNIADYFDDDIEFFEFSTLYPVALARACSQNHAAILCEGSTLKSTFANALTLFLAEASAVMARQGKPCIAYGAEVGTMEPFLEKAVTRLCRDTYFITRTEDSQKRLEELGLRGHAGTDAAWLYDGAVSAEEACKLLKAQGWDGVKPLIGIAVIDPFCWPVRASLRKWIKTLITGDSSGQYDKWYYFSDSEERRENYNKYIESVSEGVSSFIREHDLFPVVIGMERLDEKACKAVRERLPLPSAMFLSGNTSADIMTGILRKLSILATSRYHAAVLSMDNGCPIAAVSMDERLDGIMSELALDDSYLLHVTDDDLGMRLKNALEMAYADKDAIKQKIRARVPEYKQKLNEMGDFLKEYIRNGMNDKMKQ